MPAYIHKDEARMEFDAGKKRINAEGRILLDGVFNHARKIWGDMYDEARTRGAVVRLEDLDSIRGLLLVAAAQRFGGDNLMRELLDRNPELQQYATRLLTEGDDVQDD